MIEQEVESEELSDELTQIVVRESKRLASRPDIDHLDDAIAFNGQSPMFLQQPGNRVIIERFSSCLSGSPWLDTRSYIVVRVNQTSGDLKLLDEEMRHHASSNFIEGTKLGYRFKIPGRGIKALPRKSTVEKQKIEKAEPKEKKTTADGEKERRVYSTKGVIHTRIKGLAYVPQGETKATDGMRLLMSSVGKNLRVKNVEQNWEETWFPNDAL